MSRLAADEWIYLRSGLVPLQPMLDRDDVTDIYINKPGEVWLETIGGATERHEAPKLDASTLLRLARQVAAYNHQGISREHPLLSASLPDGSRIQVVAPPATKGDVAVAIRKHLSSDMTLDDYVTAGAFQGARTSGAADRENVTTVKQLIEAGDIAGGLRRAVRSRLNILISGGTSTGKTTFLNALMAEIPPHERVITIEDTPELRLRHANAVGLVAARSALGEAEVTANDLVSASLRMRPDRIILGELRGREAFAFLRAVNTGHPGSMTTIHADSIQGSIEQLALLVLEGGSTLSRHDVARYIEVTVDLYVQLTRDQRRRRVAECRMKSAAEAP